MARRTIRGLLAGDAPQSALLTASLEVVDAAGDIVLEFPFSEALIEDPATVSDPPRSSSRSDH